jgi:hypothetical protein
MKNGQDNGEGVRLPTPEERRQSIASYLYLQISRTTDEPLTLARLVAMLERYDSQSNPVTIRKIPGSKEWRVKLRDDPLSRASFCYSLGEAIAHAQHIYPGRRIVYGGREVK